MHEEQNKKSQYPLVDYMRVMMAVFVIVLHTSPMLDFSKSVEWILRNCVTIIAVPFFFIATGFFAGTNTVSIGKSVKKLIRLYVLWSLVYLPFSILRLEYTGVKGVFEYLWSFIAYGSYDTIWYLLASAVGLLVSVFSLEKLGVKKTLLLAAVFHIIALLGTAYSGLIEGRVIWKAYVLYLSVFNTFKTGVFFAFIYILIGILIKK